MTDTKVTSLKEDPSWAGTEYAQLAIDFGLSYAVEADKLKQTDSDGRGRAFSLMKVAFADFLARRRAP
jgi:hypothetical protein